MNSISLKAPAKLNLYLDIVGKLPNGYHEINSVMQSIDLFDYVKITKSENITVLCSDESLNGDLNIANKAAKHFFEHTKIKSGAKIFIDKRIPKQAGMAGGSADAAAVLFGLNTLFDEPLSFDELCFLGAKCGADVPFSLKGGTMFAEGIGEQLSALPNLPDCWIVTVKPEIGMSTPECYKYYDEHCVSTVEHESKDAIVSSLSDGALSSVCKNLYNVFEHTVNDPVIVVIKNEMLSLGALGSLMTGSGTAVFGIFDSLEKAVSAKENLSKKFRSVYISRPTSSGVQVDKSAPVYERLSELGINYERIDHPAVYTMDEMASLGIFNKGIVGKNIFLRDNKGRRHFLIFVYGDKRTNLSSIENELDIKHTSFASAERLDKYLGLTKGSVSPLGVINDTDASVEFIIDKEFIGCRFVGVHPNQNTSTIWLAFEDLLKVIRENGNKIDFIEI